MSLCLNRVPEHLVGSMDPVHQANGTVVRVESEEQLAQRRWLETRVKYRHAKLIAVSNVNVNGENNCLLVRF